VFENLEDIGDTLHQTTQYRQGIEDNNPLLLKDISNIIKYGK
jgi:hypothetical protein